METELDLPRAGQEAEQDGGGDPLQEDILEEMPSLGDSQRPVRTPQDTQLSSTPGRGDRHPTGNSASATWTGRLRSRGASSRTS